MNYTYDDNGNQKSAGSRTFTYDLANRLSATTAGSTTITYTYDGDGKRLQASSGTQASSKTNYLWDPNAQLPLLVREADGKDVLLRRYVYGADLVSMTTGAGTLYYHDDGLGSVANLTSSTGSAQWTYAYEPFGSIRTEVRNDPSAPTNLMRFTGEYFDAATSLYHLRARQYDPAIGRFLQKDNVAGALREPYLSAYVYGRTVPWFTQIRADAASSFARSLVPLLEPRSIRSPASSTTTSAGRVSGSVRWLVVSLDSQAVSASPWTGVSPLRQGLHSLVVLLPRPRLTCCAVNRSISAKPRSTVPSTWLELA